MTSPYKRQRKRRQRHREEGHVKLEAETIVMQSQTKEQLESPEAGRARKDSPLESSEGLQPW